MGIQWKDHLTVPESIVVRFPDCSRFKRSGLLPDGFTKTSSPSSKFTMRTFTIFCLRLLTPKWRLEVKPTSRSPLRLGPPTWTRLKTCYFAEVKTAPWLRPNSTPNHPAVTPSSGSASKDATRKANKRQSLG